MTSRFDKYQAIIFDFDGVVIDSLTVKKEGFRMCVNEYPEELQLKFMEFHEQNEGLPRFDKFRWFRRELLKQETDEQWVQDKSSLFSKIMTSELGNIKYQIKQTVDFIKSKSKEIELHVASGTEELEIQNICDKQGLSGYFIEIKGPPTTKEENVHNIVVNSNVDKKNILMIGDSSLDFQAAEANGIEFPGFNNKTLENIGTFRIENF